MIYVKLEDIPSTKFRIDFIRQFIIKKPATYEDPDCKILQCEEGRFRSFSEMKEIVQSRFPLTSEAGYLKIVKKLLTNQNAIIMVYCTQVNKVVFKYVNNPSGKYMSDYSMNNYLKTKGVDGLSLNSINNLLTNVK